MIAISLFVVFDAVGVAVCYRQTQPLNYPDYYHNHHRLAYRLTITHKHSVKRSRLW